MQVLRVLALVIHAVALICGLILFGSTVYIMASPSSIMTVLETDTVTAISAFACGLSLTIVAVAFVGLLGTWTESASLLKLFVGLVVVALIIEVSAIVAPFGMRRRWTDKFNDQIFAVMDKYGQDQYPYLTQMWDDFQTKWQCCGSFKAEDWSFSAYVQQEYYPVLIPPSCCKSFADNNGLRSRCVRRDDPDLYFTKGCLTVTKEVIWSYMGIVGGLSSGIFACQLFVIAVSVLLIKEYSDYEDDETAPEIELAPPSSAITSFKPPQNIRYRPAPQSPTNGEMEYRKDSPNDDGEIDS